MIPFTAIVGQEKAKLALLIAAVEPGVQGVLLVGDKGTGKTTMVRALAEVLPEYKAIEPCPYNCSPDDNHEVCKPCIDALNRGEARVVVRNMAVVDLPLSITVDRLVGTIDIQRALREGVRALEPGLLAKAHKNILYIDEVNLLDDYIVDILLDVAASGWVIVEREGISFRYPSQFILVGSMNPEEGELRPQLLDRFGLYVEVEVAQDAESRAEIVRRVEELRRSPEEFKKKYEPLQRELRSKILRARELLPKVELPDDVLMFIAKTVADLGIRTHRAEIITARAAKAIAALEGRTSVTVEDAKRAMEFTLPHRIGRRRPRPPGGGAPSGQQNAGQPPPGGSLSGSSARPQGLLSQTPPLPRQGFDDWRLLLRSFVEGSSGRGSRGVYGARSRGGIPIDYDLPRGAPLDINIFATINAALARGRRTILPEDIRVNKRRGREVRLIALVVDASKSMYANMKIAAALEAARRIAEAAYVSRDYVSLIAFQGLEAVLLLPPSRKYSELVDKISEIRIGGKTPLPSALYTLLNVARPFKKRFRGVVKAVLITDGRANVKMGLAESVEEEVAALTEELKKLGVELLAVDVRPSAYAPSYMGLLADAGWQVLCLSC